MRGWASHLWLRAYNLIFILEGTRWVPRFRDSLHRFESSSGHSFLFNLGPDDVRHTPRMRSSLKLVISGLYPRVLGAQVELGWVTLGNIWLARVWRDWGLIKLLGQIFFGISLSVSAGWRRFCLILELSSSKEVLLILRLSIRLDKLMVLGILLLH